MIYLDDDPIRTTAALAPIVERRWATGQVRARFAGPLRTMIQWDVWPAG